MASRRSTRGSDDSRTNPATKVQANGSANGHRSPAPTREWAVFRDPKEPDRPLHVDVTFLASGYRCIFGCGCQGVLTEPAPEMVQGCCSYGAHFSDKTDRNRTVKAAKRLPDAVWQFATVGRKKGVVAQSGDGWRTRLVDDACIFLNRPGFTAGAGCAFHIHAQASGEHFADLKPEVCWQLPLRRYEEEDEDGNPYDRLSEFGRTGWGEGGEEFAWWCTEAPEAFTGSSPVYRSMETELRLMLGDELYEDVARYLDRRVSAGAPPAAHPVEVAVQLGPTRRR